ncbi:DNA replication and repair protein RecF [invertebrate metagenome]|uniref:DNA replication and repair protein RecF n=1 Tax=invertebrate metagenome TaxID=1711999 RepID=A0A2H9T8Y9_9ZZZZ
MSIQTLDITNIRNIAFASLKPSSDINVLYGANGSGKTSVLEAIYMVGLARSFRSSRIRPVIRSGQNRCVVFAQAGKAIGVERNLGNDGFLIKVAGERVMSLAELAQLLPVQVINSDTFSLLEGTPSARRHFLDWGVFHMKQSVFFPAWKRLQKSLKQRNSLLRHGRLSSLELASWNHAFIRSAEVIDELRQTYIEQLTPVFLRLLNELSEFDDISINYYRGWDNSVSLEEVLQAGLERDQISGYTHAGPQRADIKIRLGKISAIDRLSRGQIKLVVCALKLAQATLYSSLQDKNCLLLIDDLPSELDSVHRKTLCQLLQKLACQVFITCVDKETLADCWLPGSDIRVFHVEQGQVNAVEAQTGYANCGHSESLETEYE